MFLVIGVAMFIYLMNRFGIEEVTKNIRGAGWSLLAAVIVWLIIYLLNTIAWKLLLGNDLRSITFSQLTLVNFSGFALNTITPVIALGGEAYKARVLARTIGSKQALLTVLVYRMIHVLGHMLMLFAGAVAALAFLTLPPAFNWMLIVSAMTILAIILLIFAGLRDGVMRRIQRLMATLPLLNRLNLLMKRNEHHFVEMDEVVTDAYRNHRRNFYGALLLECMSRACMGIEVYVILIGAGKEITIVSALFVYVTYSILINAVFFVPLNLGIREGGLFLASQSLSLAPGLGIYLGIVIRIREFVWIFLGLLCMLPLLKKTAPITERSSEKPLE